MLASRLDGTLGSVPTERAVERFDGTRLVFEGCGTGVLTQERRIAGLVVRLERVEVLDGLERLRLSSGALRRGVPHR